MGWFDYVLVAIAVLGVAIAVHNWALYRNAIRREIATSEVLCSVLLSPPLRIEFQDVAFELINSRFSPGAAASELDVHLLQQKLMTVLGDRAFLFASENGLGATLRRILGPNVIGRKPEEQWR